MSSIADITAQLRAWTQDPPADADTRRELYQALRAATLALEERHDTFHRLVAGGLLTCVARVAADLKLFTALAEASSGLTAAQLAQTAGAQELLMSHGLVSEPADGTYSASPATRMLAIPGYSAGLNHHTNLELQNWLALPALLAANGYTSPTDGAKTAFQLAHKTDLVAFDWARDYPVLMRDFALYMSVSDHGWGSWYVLVHLTRGVSPRDLTEDKRLDVFPAAMLLEPGSTPLFVDMGGSLGHVCAALKAKYPQITRELVLQDLPPVVAQALSTPGVRDEPHDFFTPQPEKGARFYYLKQILHDWPDDKCHAILGHIRDAMAPESAILIDEFVLPATGLHPVAANLDLIMMSNAAALERTRAQWEEVVGGVGLVVVDEYKYNRAIGQSLLVVRKRE